MPRTTRTPTVITRAAVVNNLTAVDNVNGEQILTDGSPLWLTVENGGAGALTVTIARPGTVDGDAYPAKTVALAAGAKKRISLMPDSLYRQGDGFIYVDYSTGTSVIAEACKITGT